MNMYEEFLRCSECNNSYFKENKVVVLDKELYEKTKEKLVIKEVITYNCTVCGKEVK